MNVEECWRPWKATSKKRGHDAYDAYDAHAQGLLETCELGPMVVIPTLGLELLDAPHCSESSHKSNAPASVSSAPLMIQVRLQHQALWHMPVASGQNLSVKSWVVKSDCQTTSVFCKTSILHCFRRVLISGSLTATQESQQVRTFSVLAQNGLWLKIFREIQSDGVLFRSY